MTKLMAAISAAFLLVALANPAEAKYRHHHYRHHAHHVRVASLPTDANGNGVVVSHKTGATAHVSPKHSGAFQAYVDDLEAHGATVRFMGGIRKGHCWIGGLHPCGAALDICQLSRGRVDSRCHLPGPSLIARIAEAHGLFEGGQWCNSDYGHAQAQISAAACGSTYSARRQQRHRTNYVVATAANPAGDIIH